MEHEPEPSPQNNEAPNPDEEENQPAGCATIIFRIIIGGVVIFLAAFAFLFGVCLLA